MTARRRGRRRRRRGRDARRGDRWRGRRRGRRWGARRRTAATGSDQDGQPGEQGQSSAADAHVSSSRVQDRNVHDGLLTKDRYGRGCGRPSRPTVGAHPSDPECRTASGRTDVLGGSCEALRYASSVASLPIVLDCDPGHDDALAIALALARPELDLLAITTVAGNAPLDRTTRNALRVLTLLGRTDVPVAAGADRPLVREPWVPVEFHGPSGLDGADLPEPAVGVAPIGALELTSRLLRDAPDPVTLVATGPLTNVALLLRAVPSLRDRIAAISLMGGSLGEGNTTAVRRVQHLGRSGSRRDRLRGRDPDPDGRLDVTHQALVLPRRHRTARGPRQSGRARVFADLMRFFAVHHRDRYGWDGPPIHDAVAVAWLADPGPRRFAAAAHRRRDDRQPHARPDGRRPRGARRPPAERRGRADRSTARGSSTWSSTPSGGSRDRIRSTRLGRRR